MNKSKIRKITSHIINVINVIIATIASIIIPTFGIRLAKIGKDFYIDSEHLPVLSKFSFSFWGYLSFAIFFVSAAILLIINFSKPFGLTHFRWRLFLHLGIIVLCFGILLLSLKLNEKAMKYIVFGAMLWIIAESIFFMSHIFEEYYFLENNYILLSLVWIAVLMIMNGFREGAK